MSNYATVADMVARFGDTEVMQLSDRNMSNQIDQAVVDLALADASAEIDCYLGRYSLPFTKVPPLLVRLCCDVARYRLTSAGGVQITAEIERRYHMDEVNLLQNLASGAVTLGAKVAGNRDSENETAISTAGDNDSRE